jgi:hypothetical protein
MPDAARRLPSADIPATGVFVLLLTLVGDVATGSDHQAFFAEPTTGRKVTHYEIDLPIKPDRRETFSIPDDCAKVVRTNNRGVTYRENIVDRRLWKKAEADCRYHGFLNRHPQHVMEDHISGYDFRNALITDLPLDRRCAPSGPEFDPAACNPSATDQRGMLRHFPIASAPGAASVRATCIPCRLSHGRFRGYVLVDHDGTECRMDANAPGVRLIAVDLADINGDRILDAVLRFVPLGPGTNRAPLILPLTKLKYSAPFTVPGQVPDASSGDS